MTPAPIALSVGEPAGIGPEIAAKAWSALKGEIDFFWIGDPRHLPPGTDWTEIKAPVEAVTATASSLPVLRHDFPGPAAPGRPDPSHAGPIIAVIERAVGLAQSGAASAVCTSPISKKALKDGAGFAFPGHTEFLAHLGGTSRVAMMLACDALRVVPATIHIPLADVPAALTAELLETAIRVTHDALIRQFGIARPRIAVAGLNPHAGEGGAIGHEDARIIAPTVARLAAEGLAVTGPYPADTMFHAAARQGYDAAVAMYHDQALIPIKTIDFDGGVNVTLGLPFIRTSPDHGTAFDIAGKGVANPASLISALRMAHRMAASRDAS